MEFWMEMAGAVGGGGGGGGGYVVSMCSKTTLQRCPR